MILPQLIVSMLLFFVLFFGISFIVNMLLRSTWFPVILYPIVIVVIIDHISSFLYLQNPAMAFSALLEQVQKLQVADGLILSSGMVGTVAAAVAIRMLRSRGYQMF